MHNPQGDSGPAGAGDAPQRVLQTAVGDFELVKTLGAGGQGKVVLARSLGDGGELRALKLIDRADVVEAYKGLERLQNEVEAMRRVCGHANVVTLMGVDEDVTYTKKSGAQRQVVCLVLEMAAGGELMDYLMVTGAFPEVIARTYFRQLVSALHACHSQDVFHRDLKPQNLLLDARFQLAVADFGLAAVHDEGEGAGSLNRSKCGTEQYMAPEVLARLPYNGAGADVWSAGVVLFIMLAGFPPFTKASQDDWWFRALARGDPEAFWSNHQRSATFSEGAMALLTRVFAPDPAQRATLGEIMADPWFQDAAVGEATLMADMQRRKNHVEREEREARHAARRAEGAALSSTFDPFAEDISRGATAAAEERPEAPAPPAPAYLSPYTTLHSAAGPAQLLARAVRALQALEGGSLAVSEDAYKAKASFADVALVVRVFQLDGDARAVEVRRRSGNALAFQAHFKALRAALAPVLSSPAEPEPTAPPELSLADSVDLV